jgi:transposase
MVQAPPRPGPDPHPGVCRLHAVLCELVPGGMPRAIIAARAARLLASITPSGSVQAARCELAAEFLEDLRHIDTQLDDTKKKLTAAVRASGTSLTGVFGVGPVIAATVIGGVRDASRFPGRDHFAAYNGTAPIEVSSGNRRVYRLSRRGNRRLNHAIHMAAVTQIRQRHSAGRAYFEKKLAGGKTRKEALRALKRRISDAIFARLQDDARRARAKGPGGQQGDDSAASAAGSHPQAPALRPSHSRTCSHTTTTASAPPRQDPPLSPAAANPARRRAAGQGGAPGAKRGRTTLTSGERRPR